MPARPTPRHPTPSPSNRPAGRSPAPLAARALALALACPLAAGLALGCARAAGAAPAPAPALQAASGAAATTGPAGATGIPGARAPSGAPSRSGPPPEGATPIRPPFHCVPGAEAPPAELVRQADDALDRQDWDRALGCADEALRATPRDVAAVADRGEALAGLKRTAEAQLAFARALAIDPEDPESLAGAADLYARDLDGSHDALEAGLALAERGLAALARDARKDRDLAVRLELAAAAAANDLGAPADALRHAERAAALAPGDADAAYERGSALFELCRFDEARAALEATLRLSPEDPWALHDLALIAERAGDDARAASLEARARAKAPADFPPPVAMTRDEFRAEVARAVAELPPAERAALAGVPVEAAELPALADLTGDLPPLSPTILGLYRGPPLGAPCTPSDGPVCRSISLYRRNLARFAHDRAELVHQIRVTLLHELGHLHGEDDDALRDRGLE